VAANKFQKGDNNVEVESGTSKGF